MTSMSGNVIPSTPPPENKPSSVEETSAERAFKLMGTMTRPTSTLKKHHATAKAKTKAVTALDNGTLMSRLHLYTDLNNSKSALLQRQTRTQTPRSPCLKQYNL